LLKKGERGAEGGLILLRRIPSKLRWQVWDVHVIAVSALRGATGVFRGHKSVVARSRIALTDWDGEQFRPGVKRGGHISLCIGGV